MPNHINSNKTINDLYEIMSESLELQKQAFEYLPAANEVQKQTLKCLQEIKSIQRQQLQQDQDSKNGEDALDDFKKDLLNLILADSPTNCSSDLRREMNPTHTTTTEATRTTSRSNRTATLTATNISTSQRLKSRVSATSSSSSRAPRTKTEPQIGRLPQQGQNKVKKRPRIIGSGGIYLNVYIRICKTLMTLLNKNRCHHEEISCAM